MAAKTRAAWGDVRGRGWAAWAALALSALAWAASEASAQERIYLANDDHTDYLWSGTEEDYQRAFGQMLDHYIAQAEASQGQPSDQRGRFNCDGSLWAWEYERTRSARDFERLMARVRAGDISLPMQSLVLLPGAMPTEAVLRDMYYAGRLERRYGLDLSLAVAMENQTLPGGLPSLWAGAGARYSWKGVCGCVSRVALEPRAREIYRAVGPDGQGVVMKWNTLLGDNTSLGGYAEARDPDAAVSFLREDPTFLASWPWEVKAAFGYGWDDLQTQTDAFIEVARARGTPARRVIVSNEVDFFEDFVASHGGELEAVTECLGNEWDLLTASMGEVSARMRRSVEKLRGAEALASVVSLHDPRFLSGREAWRDEAFLNMGLFYEHDWTANSGLGWEPRAAFQRRSVAKVERYVDALHEDGRRALGALIPGTGAARVYAFNPLSWARSGVVEVSASVGGPRHVVDVATGQEVPSQLEAGGARLVFLAQGVPPVGYRVYEVRAGVGQAWSPAAQVSGGRLDNGVVRVEVGADGALSSLVDVGRGRQLAGAGGLGRKVGEVSPDAGGAVEVLEAGPVRVRVQTLGEGAPAHKAEVALVRGSPRVELSNVIEQNFAGEVGFGFDLAGVGRGAEVHHEEVGMIARAKHKAQGGDYADALARVDWLTLGHFVDVSGAAGGVTVSSPDSAFFKLGEGALDALDEGASSLVAVVGMQVDGEGLGIPSQGGDARFTSRYALTPHAGYSPSAAMREALEHQNPLIGGAVTGGEGAPLPADQWGLLTLDGAEVVLWALKPAEEGIEDGLIARVWNVGGEAGEARLSMVARPLGGAERVTHVETRVGALPTTGDAVILDLAPQQMATVRLRLGDVGGFDAGDWGSDEPDGGGDERDGGDLGPSEDAADLDPPEDAAPPDVPGDGADARPDVPGDAGGGDGGSDGGAGDGEDAPRGSGGAQGGGEAEGCGCRAVGGAGSRLAPWGGLALGLALWRRRRAS